ncbi:MAG: peptidylprolyl isomerase [Candidatus Woesearchaeota archaeon]
MARINKKDFIEIEYQGKTKDNGTIFDTTDEKTAKEQEIFNPNMNYGPVIICVGESHVIEGLDKFFIDKEPGEFDVEIKPEKGFGKKNPKLIRLMPTSIFTKQKITPMPGLQVTLNEAVGTIRSASGGRTLVDFNHPLSGKELNYHLKITRILEKDDEKLESLMKLQFGSKNLEVELKEGKATVTVQIEVPEEQKEILTKKTKELIPGIKDIEFKRKDFKKERKENKENQKKKDKEENKEKEGIKDKKAEKSEVLI